MATYNVYKSNNLTANKLSTNKLYIENTELTYYIKFGTPIDFSKKDSSVLLGPQNKTITQIILPNQKYIPSISFYKKLQDQTIYYNSPYSESIHIEDHPSCFYYKRDISNSAGYIEWKL